MLLIFISLITGYIGYTWGLGKAYNLENILGLVGFLSPTLFLVQRIYIKLQNLEEDQHLNHELLEEVNEENSTVTNLHKIEAAFINTKIGREFKTQEIIDLVKFKYEINDSSIIPSDYCYNRMNLGKWKNPELLDFNIFEYVDRGSYRYVGENYPYNGVINYKAKGSNGELVIGEWTNGERVIYNEKFLDIDNN